MTQQPITSVLYADKADAIAAAKRFEAQYGYTFAVYSRGVGPDIAYYAIQRPPFTEQRLWDE